MNRFYGNFGSTQEYIQKRADFLVIQFDVIGKFLLYPWAILCSLIELVVQRFCQVFKLKHFILQFLYLDGHFFVLLGQVTDLLVIFLGILLQEGNFVAL